MNSEQSASSLNIENIKIMVNKKYFFAVDLGATSGRTIIGSISDGKFELEEVTRFPLLRDDTRTEGGGQPWVGDYLDRYRYLGR